MKTQSSKHHTNVVAVQPQNTFQKEDRMKKHNPTKLKLAILVAMVITMALSAGAQTAYMVTQNNLPSCKTPTCDTNTLVSVNLSSLAGGKFSATTIGPTTYKATGVYSYLFGQTAEIRGLAYDYNNDTMYGITAQGVLVTVDLINGLTTPVLTVTPYTYNSIQNEWSGLAFDGGSNLYVVNAYGSNELYKINITSTPTATFVGSTIFTTNTGQQEPQQILGLAWDASKHVLYGSDRGIDNIVIINTTNASVSLPYPDTAGVNNLQEIGFDPSGNFYAVFDHASGNNAGLATYNFAPPGTATELGALPFQIDFNGCQGCGNSTYGAGGFAFVGCVTPPSDMVAWYPFDQPGSAAGLQNDLAKGNTATAYRAPRPISIAGKVLGALSFNGTNDYLEALDRPWLNVENFSIDAWVKISSPPSGVVSLVDKRQSSPLQGYSFFLYNYLGTQPGSRLGLQLADSSGYTNYFSPPAIAKTVPEDGKWHLVTVTVVRNSSTCGTACGMFYLDGIAIGTFNPTDRLGSLNSAGTPLEIGRQEPGLASQFGGEFFKGGLDELEIFSRALSAQEVLSLYKAGKDGKCK
jgi:Concanavalin A-like lectin/glucanases superfamily